MDNFFDTNKFLEKLISHLKLLLAPFSVLELNINTVKLSPFYFILFFFKLQADRSFCY